MTRLNLTTQEGVSGVASMSAKTASAPIRQPKILSKAEGAPPLWTRGWRRIKGRKGDKPEHAPTLSPLCPASTCPQQPGVQRSIAIQCLSKSTFLTASAVIGLPSLSIAPSDTMMMFNLCERQQNKDEQLSLGKGSKKKLKKKLTNVSFMYVCVAGNGEMLAFFSFFPPTIVW